MGIFEDLLAQLQGQAGQGDALAAPPEAGLSGEGFYNNRWYNADGLQRIRPNADGTRGGVFDRDQMRDYMDMSAKMNPEWAEQFKQQTAQRGRFPTLSDRQAGDPAEIASQLRRGAAGRLYDNNEYPTFRPSMQAQTPDWWPVNPPEDPSKQSWKTMAPTFPNQRTPISEPPPQRGIKQWQQMGLAGPRPGTPDWFKQQQPAGQAPTRNLGAGMQPPSTPQQPPVMQPSAPTRNIGAGVPQPQPPPQQVPQQPQPQPPQTPLGAGLRKPPNTAKPPANAFPGQQPLTLGGGGSPYYSQY